MLPLVFYSFLLLHRVTVMLQVFGLSKWPDAYAISDQKAGTIAKLFIENIVYRRVIPEEFLSDNRAAHLDPKDLPANGG